ncbi:tripartite tricarboxylate transporter TctB family protein [Alsobacter soli]|uniref:Tripartite tricarboxylate transporter TctB family protein n=1 Tax=Alsobacter soli TaxID=2109933 RepID=A0A2T1HTN0_9HYPH|nr:tripartite tricarboxylate transporter TctB family protein [Alsobacter soli]PSC05013.1 tripartite tricarboxylate transporter TctB family protein [Alsobacter soli]
MLTRRHFEILTSGITLAFGLAIVVSSYDVGSGWTQGEVQSGTFPMLAGALVLAGSLYNLAQAWIGPNPILASRGELRRAAGLFLPALAFVALIPFIGIYVAGVAYLLWSLRVQHGMGWAKAWLIAIVAMVSLYFVFEQTFQVLLPHGWLGAAIGF